jgi:signal transduction histidine kinase
MLGGLSGSLNDKQITYTTHIAESGHHLLEMINDILDTSKIEAGKLSLSPAWIELKPLFLELEGILEVLADKKNIHLYFEIQPELTQIKADPARLRQIFLNLLSNAIKFNKEGGSVYVRLASSEDKTWVNCQIQDTGIGIPQDKMPQLFSEFFQVDSSISRQQEGTGLGLALTRKLIELHGGSISVDSEEGIGSTFTFKLPMQS